jgi:hypothetical protein
MSIAGLVVLASGAAGCHCITDLSDLQYVLQPSTSGAAGTGVGPGPGGGGEAGAPPAGGGGVGGSGGSGPLECVTAANCPVDADCGLCECKQMKCACQLVAPGTMCPGGKVCDAAGQCVECLGDTDCKAPTPFCVGGKCVDPTCTDGKIGGSETDVDCGGACPPCDNGKKCGGNGDCKSNYCSGGVCAACVVDADCAPDGFCQAGACAAKLPLGKACGSPTQCQSGSCAVDGVCCDSACDALCQACTAVKTGGLDGTCGPVKKGTDPDGECATDGTICGPTGFCNGAPASPGCALADATLECLPQGCSNGVEQPKSLCDGQGICNAAPTKNCGAYKCDALAKQCLTTCMSSMDCAGTDKACDTNGVCVADGCTVGTECMSGFCADTVCCDAACSGLCEACDIDGICKPVAPASTDLDTCAGVCDGKKGCAAGGALWSERSTGAGDEIPYDVAVDPSGNVVVTGELSQTFQYGNGGAFNTLGGKDAVVLKTDPDGKHVWSKGFGGPQDQRGLAIAVDALGNLFVAGEFKEKIAFDAITLATNPIAKFDGFLVKLDGTGAAQWAKQLGGLNDDNDDRARAVAVTAGSVVVAGDFDGALGVGNLFSDGKDAFVVKYDGNGALLWSVKLGKGGDEEAHGLAVDVAGDVYVTGWFDGDALDVGNCANSTAGGKDGFVAKLDGASGAAKWCRAFTGPDSQEARRVAVTADGRVLVTGRVTGMQTTDFGATTLMSQGGDDAFLATWDASTGAPSFAALYGDGGKQESRAIAVDPSGNAILAGQMNGTIPAWSFLQSNGGDDAFVAKLASDEGATHLWSGAFGDGGAQFGRGVAVQPGATPYIVVVGDYQGTITFPPLGALPTATGRDLFVAKLNP